MNKSKKLLMGLVYIYIYISIAAISAKDSVAFSSSGRLKSKYISKQSTYDFADTLNDDERRQIWVDGLCKARESLYGVRMKEGNRCWVACWNEDSDFENLAITKVKQYKLPSPGCWRYKLLNRKWWESKHKEELYVECYEIEETGKKWYIAWYYDYEVR